MFIKRLGSSYASVAATAALVLALTMGGAYAAGKITAKKIAVGAVSSKHIKDGQVTTADLAADAVVGFAKRAEAAQASETAKTADTATTAQTASTAESANTAKSADVAKAVAPNSVTGAGIADGSLSGADLAVGAVTSPRIGDQAVTNAKIALGAVNSQHVLDGNLTGVDIASNSIAYRHMGPASIGGTQIRSVIKTVGDGVPISAGNSAEAKVECPAASVLLAGGFAWQDAEANSIIYSAPSEDNPRQKWLVKGLVPSGSNTLFAWATCLTNN